MCDTDQKRIEELMILSLKVQTGGCENKSGIKVGTAQHRTDRNSAGSNAEDRGGLQCLK